MGTTSSIPIEGPPKKSWFPFLDNYCSQKNTKDSILCSCWQLKHGQDTYTNEIKCTVFVVFTGLSFVFLAAVAAVLLEAVDIVPDLLSLFDGVINTFLDIFQNFQWITNLILGSLKPLFRLFEKIAEMYYGLDQYVQQTFENTNPRLINIAFAEIAAILMMYTMSQMDHAMEDWKGSVGYRVYHMIDSPFRYVRKKLEDQKLLKWLFNSITLPIQATMMTICILISVLANIF